MCVKHLVRLAISNMTPEPKLSFSQTCFFPLKATLKVFLSYFVFPLKNKIKISGDSKSFSKNKFFTKQIKKRVTPLSENACENAGSTKWRESYNSL